MTDTFNEGDLIEATKGDTVIRGKAWNDCTGTLNIGGTGWSVERIEARGYAVTLIEKAAPALPTEPGVYRSRTGELWAIEGEGERLKWVGEDFIRVDPNNYVPFIRLEPVADTAKKVLDRFDAVFNASFISPGDVLNQLREEFGVAK